MWSPRYLLAIVLISLCWAALSGWLADSSGRSVRPAALLGFALGPIGLALAFLLPKRRP